MNDLHDRVALITGAGAGIGEGIAHLFAEAGARVYLLELDGERSRKVAADIAAKGGQSFAFTTDVRKQNTIAPAVEDAVHRFGRIDILINNAGFYPRQSFLDMTEEQWDDMHNVHLKGTYYCTKLSLPHMIRQKYGKIVNISTINFHLGRKNLTHYVSAKGAIIGLTRSLAREFGEHNICVNCITPGAVEVEAEKQFIGPGDTLEGLLALQCLRRRIVPLDIARVCLFLSSHWSDGMTGQTLNVDGGWYMH